MKLYIIAGEASGDLHGSNLMQAIHQLKPETQFRVWGGDLMKGAGGELIKHYKDLAFMGFIEVVKNLRTILKNLEFCKSDILAYQPDALVLIDYPGFNLRIAKWAKSQGIKVLYYISPQLWAWHSSRVHQIKENVDRMFVILPFEKEFYRQYEYEVDFVGHPLLDVIQGFPFNPNFRSENNLSEQPIIALLPGSRKQEIQRILEVMLETATHFSGYQFVIGGAPAIPANFYEAILKSYPQVQVRLVKNQTYDLIHSSIAALVTSGTATLETALIGTPQVVCYKGNQLSYWIARRLVDIKYISLVNLILDQPLVKELIQDALTPQQLKHQLMHILDPITKTNIKNGYDLLKEKLGTKGASGQVAKLILEHTTEIPNA